MTYSANIMEVLADVQTELVFFALAIGTHILFFNKWSKGSPYSMFFNKLSKGDEFAKNQINQKSAAPSSNLVALKASLRKGDIASAMSHFEALMLQNGDESPSSAPQVLMEQLMKVATQNGAQSELLALLTRLGLSANAFDLMLAESAGNTQEVRKIMESMRADGLTPSIVTFNKLLGAAIASDAQTAWNMVGEMKAFGVKPDSITCAILLKSRCINSKATNLEKVIAIMDGLDGGMDEVLFNSVVDACIRVGRADLMMPFLKKQRNSQRSSAKGAHTYGSIIRAYGYVQDMKGAWDTWHEMRKLHITPISVTLGCMVEAVVTNGDIEGGYEIIHDMLSDEKTAHLVNAVMYGSIVKGFSHNKNFSRMWQVYDEMVAQKLQFSMVTFNTLIDACARSGELSRISSLLKDMKAQDIQMGVVTYSAIIKGYCQKNMLDEAFELFHDMAKSTDLKPDEIMYNTLLDGCARQGLYVRGMSCFEEMKQSGVRPSNYTLSVLVKLANRGKKLEKAFEICDELSSKYSFRLNVHVYANLIQACIKHHDFPRALGVLERMLEERVRPDVRCYSLLLRACVDSRLAKDAAGLLRAAMGVGEAHPWNGPHPRIAKYGATAKPQGGLPGDLISEIVLGIMDFCQEERLATALLVDLGRLPGLKLDPKLRLRSAARMADLH